MVLGSGERNWNRGELLKFKVSSWNAIYVENTYKKFLSKIDKNFLIIYGAQEETWTPTPRGNGF